MVGLFVSGIHWQDFDAKWASVVFGIKCKAIHSGPVHLRGYGVHNCSGLIVNHDAIVARRVDRRGADGDGNLAVDVHPLGGDVRDMNPLRFWAFTLRQKDVLKESHLGALIE